MFHENYFDIDTSSVDERGGDPRLTPVSDQRSRSGFRGGMATVHAAYADSLAEVGFRPITSETGEITRELGRSVKRNDEIGAARARAKLAKPGTEAEAALADAAQLADTYGHVMRATRMRIARQSALSLAQQLRGRYGVQQVADSVVRWRAEGLPDSMGNPRRFNADRAALADADLAAPGGLVENLTSWLYMAFLEPQAPLHYRDVFRIQGGIGLGLMRLQVLFYAIRGEAKEWDGTGGDYRNSGPGVSPLYLPIIHFRSSDVRDIITEAREQLVFGAAGLRQMNLIRAHDVLHNRMAFGISRANPPQLPIQGLATYPGLLVRSSGLDLASATSNALYQELVAAMEEPKINSNQAFEPDTLAITPRISQALKAPMVIGGVTVADSIESFFRKNYPGVDLRPMWELSGLMGSGVESIFAFPKGTDAAPYYLMNEPLTLPQWTNGYSVEMNAYSTAAGVLIPSPVGAELRNIDQT